MNTTTHILKMTCGITCSMLLNETTGHFDCTWSPEPPFAPDLCALMLPEYLPWRDRIIKEWAQRTGRSTLLVTLP